MTPRQRHKIDYLETKKGYRFEVERLRRTGGQLLIRSRGHWVPEVALVLNPDGSYHAAFLNEH